MRQAGILAAAGPGRAVGRPGRHDRTPGRGPRQRPAPGRGAGRDGRHRSRPAGTAQPAPGPLDPGRVRTNFVVFKVARDRAAFLAALRARGRPDGGISARTGPRGDPLRRDRRRHRDDHRRHPGGPGRDRSAGRSRPIRSSPPPDPRRPPRPARPTDASRPGARHDRRPLEDHRDRSPPHRRRPAPAPGARRRGPPTTRFYDLVEARFRRLVARDPVLAHVARPPRRRRPARRRQPRRGPRRARRRQGAPGRGRGDRPGRPVAGGPLRARPRAPQRPPGDLRHRRPAHLGAPLVRAGHDRRRAVPAVRPRPRAARRAARRPSPAGSRRSPPTSRSRRPGRPSRRSGAGSRSRSRPTGELPALLRRARGRRDDALCAPAEQRRLERAPRGRQGRGRAVRDVARGHARERHGRVGDRSGAARRAGRASRVRRPRRRRDPRARLAEAGRGEGGRASAAAREIDPDAERGRRSSTGSRRTARPTSTAPSRATGRRCSGRART